MPMYLSVSDAAKRYGFNRKFVYDLLNMKVLPCVKFEKPGTKRPVIRIPIDALEKWELKQLEGGGK
jgi:hypothetical protein